MTDQNPMRYPPVYERTSKWYAERLEEMLGYWTSVRDHADKKVDYWKGKYDEAIGQQGRTEG